VRPLLKPWPALGLGLLAVPVAKLLYVPNYVFNFLTTLVHEIGHSLAAWLMGMPSIPTVSPLGGGVTVWRDQVFVLALAVWAGLIALAWRARTRPPLWIPLGVAALVYPLLAFTPARSAVASAGGVLLEIGGAAICFTLVLGHPLERPFERPLYALWGWWMLVNRAAETYLMLRSEAYWESQRVIQSGLAAGLTSDLEVLRSSLGWPPGPVLVITLLLCLAALPAAIGAARLLYRDPGTPDTIRACDAS
jgi:peptidase M50B-like protein